MSSTLNLSSIVPPNPTTQRGQSTKLSLSPKGDRIAYTNGRSVIIRPLPGFHPSLAEKEKEKEKCSTILYSQHPHPVTIARFSPSGAYVASADTSGLVRIWDILGSEQILKAEYRPFSGVIRDLSWDSESKRIAVVGEGRDRFGSFFLVDSGSSCGELSGHSKVVSCVAIKNTRPFKAVTGGDDNKVVFFSGVPFKYTSTLSTHTRFLQSIVYSPSGKYFASCSSDSKVVLYDGSTGEAVGTIDSAGGGGTVFDVAFVGTDDSRLVSVAADGLAKLWTLPQGEKVAEWDLKVGHPNAGDQLVAVVVSNGSIGVALNLLGELITFDISQPGAIKGRYLNPTKGITTAVRVSPVEILAASWDGNVYRYQRGKAGEKDWQVSTVQGFKIGGPVVTFLKSAGGKTSEVYAVGMDDVLRRISDGKTDSLTVPLPSAAKGLSVSPEGDVFVLTTNSVVSLPTGSTSLTTPLGKLPTSSPSALFVSKTYLAIGSEEGKVYLYPLTSLNGGDGGGGQAEPSSTIQRNRSAITSLCISPDEALLASADSTGKIPVLSLSPASLGDVRLSQWCFHTSRISSLSFSPRSTRAISSGLDCSVYIWSTERPTSKVQGRNLHAAGVSWCAFLHDDNRDDDGDQEEEIVTVGNDGAMKIWTTTK